MKKILSVFVLILVLTSCKKDPKPGSFTLEIKHNVAGETFVLNEEKYTSPAGHHYEITKLWYYISEVSLIGEDGLKTTQSGAHLVKAEDLSTYTYTLNKMQPGKYNKIQFQFGIAKEFNKESYLESNIDNQNMFWPTQMEQLSEKGDFHYMQFEGRYDSLKTGVVKTFMYHSGPTNGADNSFTVTLPLSKFEINDNSFNLKMNADLQEWLQNPTIYDFKEHKNVMMNQSIQDIYKANGATVFSIGEFMENGK